jgi:hypothetical protein
MKRNSVYVYIAASLAMLVPVPGRFACGLCILVLFNLLMFTGTLFLHAIHSLHLDSFKTVLMTAQLIALTILGKQCLTFLSPVLSLMLGFSLFLPTLSSVIIGYFFDATEKKQKEDIRDNMIQCGLFSLFSLLFFLFRDVFGYGTVTLPSRSGMFVIYLPFSQPQFSVLTFIASIPGALVLISILLALFVHITNKLDCIERTQK